MINIDKIVNKHLKQVEEFKQVVADNESREDIAVINKLLTCEPMIVYSLFKVSQDHLEGMLGLFHSLRHAFLDDGEYQIIRTENPFHKDAHEMMNRIRVQGGEDPLEYEPLYMYSIGFKDGQRPLEPKDLDLIIDAYQKAYDYYDDNKKVIENSSDENLFNEKSKYFEWISLEDQANSLMEKIYIRNEWND